MVLSIGEILVDVFVDRSNKTVFPGGAPFNIASNIEHLNGEAGFYGVIGKDDYGKLLKEYCAKKNFSYLLLEESDERYTTQALVTLNNGERDFRFVREKGADYDFNKDFIYGVDMEKLNIVHIGSLMLSEEIGRTFFKEITSYYKQFPSVLISFDVNYRDDIFANKEEAKKIMLEAIKCADILKFSNDEIKILTGEDDVVVGIKKLITDKQHAFITLGKDGSMYYFNNKVSFAPTTPLKPIDTTGAGDAFYSYILCHLDKDGLNNDETYFKNLLKRANIAGGMATLKKGAVDVIPSEEEITKFIKEKNI